MVYAPDYGVPQTRKTITFTCVKIRDISLIEPEFNSDTHPTLRDTIGKLPEIKAGETSEHDPLHRCRNLSDLNLKESDNLNQEGTWRDWDVDLL